MRIRLVVRYTVITSIVLLVLMSISAYLHITKVEKIFSAKLIHDANDVAEMLLRDSYHLMLEDNRSQLQKMIVEVGKSDRVIKARILGKKGVINFSTDQKEIGVALSEKDDSCSFCHTNDSMVVTDVPVEISSRPFLDKNGKQAMHITQGIYNDPNCYTAACHFHTPEEIKIGVLDLVVSLEEMTTLSETHTTDVVLSSAFMVFIMSICLHFLTKRYISNPIEGLLEQSQALAEGNLSARVKNMPNDELGELGRSFNNMADNLSQAQIELKDWGNTLEHKVEERTLEITEMQSQLLRSAKLASMGELVAGVAHEINNPLTGILMFSSLSSKTPDLPPQVKENLDMIVSETGRCAKIVRGLLEFARESFPEKKKGSINRIIKHTLTLVSQQSIFQDVEIKCHCDEHLPELEIDADQLQQVFFNMFINAGQAMPEGGTLTITTKTVAEENTVQIIVEDTGTGISTIHLDKVFDPFFSTKSQQGFGLGLSVSYGIIQNHGGRVEVRSNEDAGTRFTIYLPIEQESIFQEINQEKGTSSE